MIRKWNSLLRQRSNISERLLVTLVFVGILSALAAAISAQSLSDTHKGGGQLLEGVFLVNVTPDPGGPPPFMVIRLFTPTGEVVGPQASLFGGVVRVVQLCADGSSLRNRQNSWVSHAQ